MKKVHRFLVTEIPKNGILADASIVHQIVSVLRISPGENIILFVNGGNDELFEILDTNKKEILLRHMETRVVRTNNKTRLIAAVAIPKGDTFELIVQKLTEVGVQDIVPLLTDRTVKKSVRLERLQAISDEALEQCGGTIRTTIHEPMGFSECIRTFSYPGYMFEIGPHSALGATPSPCIMYIGPEGGWSENDIALLTAANVETVSLGERVMRTETAAIVAAHSLLQ